MTRKSSKSAGRVLLAQDIQIAFGSARYAKELRFKKRPWQLGLANDGHQSAGAKLRMIRDWHSDSRVFYSFLHYDMTSPASRFRKPVMGKDATDFPTRQNA